MLPVLRGLILIGGGLWLGACEDDSSGSCPDLCQATIAAHCARGPVSQAACESECEAQQKGSCGFKGTKLVLCSAHETVSCDSDGEPRVLACSKEKAELDLCQLVH